MRRLLVLLCLSGTLYAQGPAGARSQETVRSDSRSKGDDGYAHVIMATQYGNATIRYVLPPGMTQHQLTWRTDATVTSLTVTVSGRANTGAAFTPIGTATALGGTITGSGTFTEFQIVYSGYAGSGAVDADYFGVNSLIASPLNTHTMNLVQINGVNVSNPIGADPVAIERTNDTQTPLQVRAAVLYVQSPFKLLLPCNALRTTNCQ